MAENHEVEALIDDAYAKLIAAEAAHPDSPELAALHASLKTCRDAAVAHFGLEQRMGIRSGGGDKPKDPPTISPEV